SGSSSQGSLGWELRAGTPGYMSPEQRSTGAVGCGADVFAFGVIAREMMTGRAPTADTADDASHLVGRTELQRFVLSCLAANEADRPRDGSALVVALLAVRGRSGLRRALGRPVVTAL